MFRDECRRIVLGGEFSERAPRRNLHRADNRNYAITIVSVLSRHEAPGRVTGRKFTGGYVACNWILRLVINRILPSQHPGRVDPICFNSIFASNPDEAIGIPRTPSA